MSEIQKVDETKEISELRKRFKSKGFGVKSWATAHGFNHAMVSLTLDGKFSGKNRSRKKVSRKIITQLREDGVYEGEFAWEVGDEKL
jgi:gp16 family phage-associated protein